MINTDHQSENDTPENATPGNEKVTAVPPAGIYPLTENNQPAIMEVHAQELHKAPGHGWKHYFFEFFMLFLAVFCGFLAENYRENLVEHEREGQYIRSLVSDLKTDQDILTRHMADVSEGLSMMDSLISLLQSPATIAQHSGQLYYLARLAPRLRPLAVNDRTFEQLKNSGNFRLIRKLATSNKIMTYYELLPLDQLLLTINETEFTEYKKAVAKIFNPAVFMQMEGPDDEIKRTPDNPPLRTTDNELLQELSAFAVYLHGTKKGVLVNEQKIKARGAELIGFLQKEYNLE